VIDHISIGVGDLAKAGAFYHTVLGVLGYAKLVEREGTIGFGKKYPEFWLNRRLDLAQSRGHGSRVALRVETPELVEKFWHMACDLGAQDVGRPGPRPEYSDNYYAAFISDSDGHVIEAVCFIRP
jgi:catechol 2,3-dioxygenase-like lactoylglutathione lyase family enzyme